MKREGWNIDKRNKLSIGFQEAMRLIKVGKTLLRAGI